MFKNMTEKSFAIVGWKTPEKTSDSKKEFFHQKMLLKLTDQGFRENREISQKLKEFNTNQFMKMGY